MRARYPAPGGWDIAQGYDGDRQRVKKVEGGQTTVYLRSTVLGGQIVGEYNQSGVWLRGYVYDGGAQLLAMQAGGVQWVHQDPVTKSQRVTDRWGNFISAIDVDPWGGETSRMENGSTLSRKFTTYERDGNGRDQAMQRSYHAWFSRFDQPDPYDGSYDLTNPQSFNRYAYVGNDPVNFTDPTGLEEDEVVRVYTWAPAWNWREQSGGRSGGVMFPRMYRREDPRGGGGDPQNPAPQQQRLSQEDCDNKIAALFGGPGAKAATANEPPGVNIGPATTRDRSHHLANSGVFHIYTDAQGSDKTTGLFIPSGGSFVRGGEYYNEGDLENYFRFSYTSGPYKGVTLSLVHVGGTSGGEGGGQRLGRFPGQTNAAGSVRIGNIAGLGGEGNGYNHTHVKVYFKGKLTDPRKVFCGW